MKIDYNNLLSIIDDTLDADNIETVHENAFGIAVGLEMLNGFLREAAQHGIDTKDEFLIELFADMGILKVKENTDDRSK